jgi:acyl-CoA reductase-like NAD-dependent aldehyde dehydrogenase
MAETTFSTTNPADDSPLTPVKATPIDAVAGIVAKARDAQPEWGAMSVDARAERLIAAARHVLENRAEGLKTISAEMGRSETESLMDEMASIVEFARAAIRAGKKALAPERIKLSALDYPGKKAVIEMVPRGVIGVIAPWNYPLGNLLKSFFPALLAGNGLVIKPSEHTPRTAEWFVAQVGKVLPKGLVGLVQGGGDAGRALIEAGVDAIVFTGSVRTGRKVAALAGEHLIPCSVELGGKDAAIVLGDCDLERTVAGIAQWGLHNAGQNCAAIERVYVEASIAEQFLERLAAFVSRVRVAPQDGPSEIAPLQNAAQLEIVKRHVSQARDKGARVLCGGKPTGKGHGFQPTVLADCTEEMDVVTEETFGPVLAVVKVKDAEEALERANASSFGLNGSVWTRDIERGAALARRMQVGICLVNNHAITGIMPELPWTGVKDTGFGVASSRHAYHTFARPRTLFTDSSSKPDPWWMPADENFRLLGDALVDRQLRGGLGALFRLAGLVGKRVKAIREAASEKAPKALPAAEKSS